MITNKNDLAHSLADSLNKQFKKNIGKVAHFLGEECTPTDLNDWISTGSSMLDLAISNRPNGGLPVGRICEINGLESSGKSLVAAHILANAQKQGGIAVYIDTENALSMDFLKAIGVDLKKMVYAPLDTVEQIFEVIEHIINRTRENEKNKIVVIVTDSVAGASTKNEMEGDYDKEGWATDKAIIISKALRKITRLIGKERILLVFSNQLRDKLGVTFGEKLTTSGGKALGFHSSVRIRLKQVGKITKKTMSGDQIIGIKTRAQIIKSRVGPPLRMAEFDIYFDRGIDDYGNWLQILKDYDIVKRSNPGFKVKDEEDKEYKFEVAEWSNLLNNNQKLKEFLYNKICDISIMKYRSKSDDKNNKEIEKDQKDEIAKN